MKPDENAAVAHILDAYPAGVRKKLLTLRALISKTARDTHGVGTIGVALQWGEPA